MKLTPCSHSELVDHTVKKAEKYPSFVLCCLFKQGQWYMFLLFRKKKDQEERLLLRPSVSLLHLLCPIILPRLNETCHLWDNQYFYPTEQRETFQTGRVGTSECQFLEICLSEKSLLWEGMRQLVQLETHHQRLSLMGVHVVKNGQKCQGSMLCWSSSPWPQASSWCTPYMIQYCSLS